MRIDTKENSDNILIPVNHYGDQWSYKQVYSRWILSILKQILMQVVMMSKWFVVQLYLVMRMMKILVYI